MYSFQCIRTLTQNKIVWTLYCLIVFVIISYISYSVINYDRASGFNHSISYSIGLFFALFIFQSLIILGLLIEDIYRVPQAIYTFFTDESKQSETFFPQRRKILSQILFLLASIPFGAILYGMIRGKYNFKVLKYDILYDDLPKSFDGFTITQISDIHCGSFDNPQKVEYGLDLVNKQKSDVILFTGEIVNNTSEESYP
ncbi:MAG: phosphoesterase, partial [Flavobacteriaceae bacterium]|nr:phosphoesterase [Flavobacteriaceae bacterium]